ncbi:MAG: ribonuclease HII [Oscillospiraceae bacterium]|nr:ribonuclease HII [Oscillospiraceae bacterium]
MNNHNSLYDFDDQIRLRRGIICGVDEAGRGPLAGDVYAAAVILPEGIIISGLDDSKKLTEKKREELYDEIIKKASAYSVAWAIVAEIEELNILGASLLAMRRAVEGLDIKPDYALIDGNQKPALEIDCEAVIKGDGLSASIAAASILAKVSRDRVLLEISKIYPQYAFEKHKGYGTKLHYEKLREHGACPVHRMSFLKKL